MMEACQDQENDPTAYKVLINHEGQYSIWPAERKDPKGWREVGKKGTKTECLTYIDEHWVDMCPLSVRKMVEQGSRKQGELRKGLPESSGGGYRGTPQKDLVSFLSDGAHPIEVAERPISSAGVLREAIRSGNVHLAFIDTRGRTELRVNISDSQNQYDLTKFEEESGVIHIAGTCNLNSKDLELEADIDLGTLTGQGYVRLAKNPMRGAAEVGD